MWNVTLLYNLHMNETKNTNIVRNKLNDAKYFENEYADKNGILIYEQSIDKNEEYSDIFDFASKKKTGKKGFPDFFINLIKEDVVIIIESKANENDLYSKNLDMPEKFALDGAIHYGNHFIKKTKTNDSYTKKKLVIIGTAGEEKENFKYNVQYWNEFGKLLLQDSYLEDFPSRTNIMEIFSSLENNKKIEKLSSFSSKLHNDLYEASSQSHENPLIISAILISLHDDFFRKSYNNFDDQYLLAQEIINAVSRKLKAQKLGTNNINALLTRIEFLKSHVLVNSKKISLSNVVYRMHKHVYSYMASDVADIYADELGMFYNEFLKYTGSGDGKALGIVLTPFHIAELFADIAEVNKNSVVFDPAAGTGGFLVASLKKMFSNNPNDKEKERIKKSGIIGYENKSNIYALLISNMIIRNDGKSNLFQKSVFSSTPNEIQSKYKPTVGMVNPPYSQKSDHEFKFILHMLDSLVPGSTGIAIIPTTILKNNDTSTGKKIMDWKQKILKKHTLMGSFTLRHDLFGSQAGVNTNILVFRAGYPHDNKKVFLASWVKDNLTRKKGSVTWTDDEGKWLQTKNQWLKNFINKKTNQKDSILVNLSHNTSWVPEDYFILNAETSLTRELIDKHIIGFHNQKLINQDYEIICKVKQTPEWNPDFSKFEKITLSDYFDVYKNKSIPKKLRVKGNIPYVGASMNNNGISEYISPVVGAKVIDFKSITFGAAGQTGSGTTFFQNYPYIASATVFVLKPKFNMSITSGIFIAALLELEKERFSFGNKPSDEFVKNIELLLPIKKNGEIDDQEVLKILSLSKFSNLI